MVLETSALVAILVGEPEAETFARALEGGAVRMISAVSVFEAAIVLQARKGARGGQDLALLKSSAAIVDVESGREGWIARFSISY
jgi:ribonuclease VapC